jgi:hypothetical protein
MIVDIVQLWNQHSPYNLTTSFSVPGCIHGTKSKTTSEAHRLQDHKHTAYACKQCNYYTGHRSVMRIHIRWMHAAAEYDV